MNTRDDLEIVAFADVAQWESWLTEQHDRKPGGVWMKIAKKGSDMKTVTLPEALDVALCYGWIDSLCRRCDDTHYLQKYSPRRPRSSWSQVNVDKVEALIAAGRMREPGFAAIRAAKADGRWDAAYEPQRKATVPDDLASALKRNGRARARFEELGRTGRYALLLRLMKARTPRARAAQLQRIIVSLEQPGNGQDGG
ncbi:YdeI/OmpD-associated family protein [Amycolatopsis palatopharyngis]|uniref:YdeI/OmpD-associated family protein n=1 Tax=Amycolatopsis palatopharyngis TaxID=187982 RepID=UPI001FE5B2EA|nr:YdeI/OmpD-associated family protein [Amycolatopsis palatopharyngis]